MVKPICGICRWLWDNKAACLLLSNPPDNCRWFQEKKGKRVPPQEQEHENSAAEDYLDYLTEQY